MSGTGAYPSKTSWYLDLVTSEGTLDAAGNRSMANWALYLIRGNSDTPFNNVGSAWAVSGPGGASGTFPAYRFGSSGTGTNYSGVGVGGSVLIASGGGWVAHNPDGSGSTSFSASHAAGATLGTASIGTFGMGLTTLTVVPATPSAVTATYVSDTQATLNWTQVNASNGAPTATKIQQRINNGAWADLLTVGNVTTANVTTAANQKIEYQIQSTNAAGTTPYSAVSSPLFTTPAAPTLVSSAKDSSLDIVTTWTDNVPFTEHTHEVWHGTVAGGVTTWDGSALATVASGTTSYTHVTPNPAQAHVYEVRAVAGGLDSPFTVGNTVQLLTAPGKPSTPAMNPYADKAATLEWDWVHNSIDSTPQTGYEFQVSTNGGTTWTAPGKTVSTMQHVITAANTYAAGVAVTTRVRTWGSATTGGADGTGASPWSDLRTVTYETAPTTTITSPATGGTIGTATVKVNATFASASAATFVKAHVQLLDSTSAVLEEFDSTILLGITFATPVANGHSYSVKIKVLDSNGVWSSYVTSAFSVVYTLPVPAVPTLSFLQDSGFGQLALSIPAPGGGQVAATLITIDRSIGGVKENVVTNYPVSALLTFLDTTPVVNGDNVYTFTTTAASGSQSVVTATLTTTELHRAYLSKGAGYATSICFGGNLSVDETLEVASTTIEAAGRTKPVGLFGTETNVQLKVSSDIFENFGTSVDAARQLLLIPGEACYRDASQRRVFGSVKGGISYKKALRASLSFNLVETS